jgi:hypothetical protein
MANGLVFTDEEEPVGLAMVRSSGSKAVGSGRRKLIPCKIGERIDRDLVHIQLLKHCRP